MQGMDGQDDFLDDDVEIVDLGVPDKGFSCFLFLLSKKRFSLPSRRSLPLLLLCVLGLCMVLLQSGSSLVSHQSAGSSSSRTIFSNSSAQLISCGVLIIITPGQSVISALPLPSPVVTSNKIFNCSDVTTIPALPGNSGQKP